jgi:hypothetical protein
VNPLDAAQVHPDAEQLHRDAEQLHRDAVVVDTHNDLLCSVVLRPVNRWGSYFRERWLPQLRAGGVDVQVLPVWIDDPYRPEGALRQTLRMIEAAHRIAAENPRDVALCADAAQVDTAVPAASRTSSRSRAYPASASTSSCCRRCTGSACGWSP